MDWVGDGECSFFFSHLVFVFFFVFFLIQHFAERTGNASLS